MLHYLKKSVFKLMRHDLRVVYIDLCLRLSLGFYLFTIITVKVDTHTFSLYAFSVLISSLIVQIINGSTEVLINNELRSNKNYFNFFLYKITLIQLLFLPFFFIIEFNIYLMVYFLISIFVVVNEHIELKLRYFYNYSTYKSKIILQLVFFAFKYFSAKKGDIFNVILYSLIESGFLLIVSYFSCKKYFNGSNEKIKIFIVNKKSTLLKYVTSSLLIFLFFKLDQIYIYFKVNSHVFVSYFIASRFNEILNSMVAIWTRYSIPKLFLQDDINVFRKYIYVNITIHLVFSILFFIPVFFYVAYLNPIYSSIIYIYMILAISGIFLVFGQVRGIYFVKKNSISPDIINAIVGILTFLVSVWLLQNLIDGFYIIPISYLIGFMVSGFLTTFFYKLGRKFMSKLIFYRR